mmetsp:Transcript_12441/g.17895  ORF Transcript_12441/g.17895 Transcript_12441/m.17895 type:complete len:242 (-) Transcript_12441:84-809(-)
MGHSKLLLLVVFYLASLNDHLLFVLSDQSTSDTAHCLSSSKYGKYPNPAPEPDPPSPDVFSVKFDVQIDGEAAEPIILKVIREWAPLGADRFYALMKDSYYNNAAFFRVVPNFVLQCGIAASPKESSKWDTPILDDPVVKSNTNWTVSYATAGPDTRTTQIFINYVNNSRLDSSGFAPFAMVTSGFKTALNVVNPTPGDRNGVNQGMYYKKGNKWILKKYPNISTITCSSLKKEKKLRIIL